MTTIGRMTSCSAKRRRARGSESSTEVSITKLRAVPRTSVPSPETARPAAAEAAAPVFEVARLAREVAFCPWSEMTSGSCSEIATSTPAPGQCPDLLLVRRLGLEAGRGLPYTRCEHPLHVLASPIGRRVALRWD